jgi:hypothetical protein
VWKDDNPSHAARDFVAMHTDFVIEQPAWRFNENPLETPIAAWPDAWNRRLI